MKSDHRRELHANELEKLTGSIGSFFEKNGKLVLLGVVGVAVVVGGVIFGLRMMGNPSAEATAMFASAESADDLLIIADRNDFKKTKLAPLARLDAADQQLQEGIRQYFTTRKAGMDELKKAKENYEQVLDAKIPDWARLRALYGLAVATESMSGKDTSAAIKAYEKVMAEFPESIYNEACEKRIERLKRQDIQEFYAFLSSGDHKPSDRKKPTDLGNPHLSTTKPTLSEPPVRLDRIPPLLQMDLDEPKAESPPFPKSPTDPAKNTPETKTPAEKEPAGPKLNSPKFPPAPAPSKSPAKTPAKTK